MRPDRVAEDTYVLISDEYAWVTSTVLFTGDGAIVIDTMPFAHETQEIISFIESRIGPHNVSYVINSHHHADHVYGTYLFEESAVIAHDECRVLLGRLGQPGLERARQGTPELAEVKLRLPDITFQEEMHIHLGHRHLHLFHTPGHSPDGVCAFVAAEKVLIAGDVVMPVPYIVGGDIEQLKRSLLAVKAMNPSFIIQGHGTVLLRGEVDETIDSSISYLSTIVSRVSDLIERGDPPQKLREIDIESCGKSRIPLDGLVSRLHLDNLIALYKEMSAA